MDKSQARINESIKRVAKKKFKDDMATGEKFIGESIANLNIATNPDAALSTADLVVEAVTENLGLKKKLFSRYLLHVLIFVPTKSPSLTLIEEIIKKLILTTSIFRSSYDLVAPAKTIFASNTSSLAIGDIAASTPNRLDRFGGLHFFNPVPVMKLLEVCEQNYSLRPKYICRLYLST